MEKHCSQAEGECTCGCRKIPDDAEGGAAQDPYVLLPVWFPFQSMLCPQPSSPCCSFCPMWQLLLYFAVQNTTVNGDCSLLRVSGVLSQPVWLLIRTLALVGAHACTGSAVVSVGLWSPVLMSDGLDPSTATVSHVTVSHVARCFIYIAVTFLFFAG